MVLLLLPKIRVVRCLRVYVCAGVCVCTCLKYLSIIKRSFHAVVLCVWLTQSSKFLGFLVRE
jgi:hypothetical protein